MRTSANTPATATGQRFHQGRGEFVTAVVTAEPVASAADGSAAAAEVIAGAERPESVSRRKRFRSVRKSAAL
jgi:hypothetical protein